MQKVTNKGSARSTSKAVLGAVGPLKHKNRMLGSGTWPQTCPCCHRWGGPHDRLSGPKLLVRLIMQILHDLAINPINAFVEGCIALAHRLTDALVVR